MHGWKGAYVDERAGERGKKRLRKLEIETNGRVGGKGEK